MKRRFICLSFVILTVCFAQAGQNTNQHEIDPDEAYKNNCMRCHASTQQYSPRMTKTIIMHMRVRANLPEDVAQAILEYLNGESEAVRPVAKAPKSAGNQAHQGRK
jgi:hypothetical protein